MQYVSLGKTNILVSRTAFGTRSLCKIADRQDAVDLVRCAYDGGVNFFDTARSYGDSETKLGYSFYGIRKDIILASKTSAKTPDGLFADLHTSLNELQTDYLDLYQLQNLDYIPQPDGPDGLYNALLKVQQQGKIRSFGFSTHSPLLARLIINSGLYVSVQYPFSLLADTEAVELVKLCEEKEIGFIGMQPLCGGLLTNIPLAFGFVRQYENVIPLWGVQKIEEMQHVLYFDAHPPLVDQKFLDEVEVEKRTFMENHRESAL